VTPAGSAVAFDAYPTPGQPSTQGIYVQKLDGSPDYLVSAPLAVAGPEPDGLARLAGMAEPAPGGSQPGLSPGALDGPGQDGHLRGHMHEQTVRGEDEDLH
jgi:hypothetical protein